MRNQDRNSNAVVASKLFKHVASQVWKKDTEASLDRKTVAFLRAQCIKQEGEIDRIFANVEKLYTEGNSLINTILLEGFRYLQKVKAFNH